MSRSEDGRFPPPGGTSVPSSIGTASSFTSTYETLTIYTTTATSYSASAVWAAPTATVELAGTVTPYLLPFATTLSIDNYPPSVTAPYDVNYIPAYTTLPDGSLLSPLYTADLASSNVRLFGVSALLTLFIITVWMAATFIRRAQLSSIKDKTLFYLLLVSQIMGPICFLALLVPFFFRSASCSIANTIAVITTELSYALLITAILGLKAYRCLNRSRLVIITVAFFQLLIFALFSLDLPNITSTRLLSGACNASGKIKYLPAGVILTIAETFFIGLCFSYAIWKSSLYPAAQGRLSISLSIAPNLDQDLPPNGIAGDENPRRGWWDYVPQAPAASAQSPTPAPSIRRIRESFLKPFSPTAASIVSEFGEKSPRRAAMRRLEGDTASYASIRSRVGPLDGPPIQEAPLESASKERQPYEEMSKDLGMVQMRAVIMDELAVTTFITGSNIIVAVLTSLGANKREAAFGPSIWVGANWAFISLLIMRSFSSVIQRHEKDAIIQQYHPPASASPWVRRRRDAVTSLEPYSDVQASSRTLNNSSNQPVRRSNTLTGSMRGWEENNSWEVGSSSGFSSRRERGWPGAGMDSGDDAASIRRREGLREWALERDARRAAAAAAATQASVPPMPAIPGNPFTDSEVSRGGAESEEGDLGRMWELTPRPRPDVERGIIVKEPGATGGRRGTVTDRRKAARPPPPPPPVSRRSSSLSVTPKLPERKPSNASSTHSTAEHSQNEPLLSPRTFTRD